MIIFSFFLGMMKELDVIWFEDVIMRIKTDIKLALYRMKTNAR